MIVFAAGFVNMSSERSVGSPPEKGRAQRPDLPVRGRLVSICSGRSGAAAEPMQANTKEPARSIDASGRLQAGSQSSQSDN
jgi:hypothetical protein